MTEFQPVLSQPYLIEATAKITGHSQKEQAHERRLELNKAVPKTALEEEYPLEVPLCVQPPEQPDKKAVEETEEAGGSKKEEEKPVLDTGEDNGEQPEMGEGCVVGEKMASDTKDSLPAQIAHGYAGEPWGELFTQAVNLHKLGVEGDQDAVKEAHKLLEKLRSLAPKNTLAEAYYGSATSLLGRDAANPTERFNKAIRGLKILDSVVAREPESIEIRTLRAYVCYRLPENFFHRTGTAVEDLSYLAARYEGDPSFSQDFYCQVLFDLGASYKRLSQDQEAESTWQKLLSSAKDPKYIELLRAEGFHAAGLIPAQDTGQKTKPQDGKIEKKLAEGIKLRDLALKGDTEASRKAFSFFKKAMAANPDEPLARAYYADCMSLAARDSADPGEMFSTPIKASKIMDSAVNSSPGDVRIRMIRAYHCFRLPEAFFRRTAPAIADFEHLIQMHEKDQSVFPTETYWQLLYDLSVAYQRLRLEEEALSTRKKLLSLNPDSKFKALIDENGGHELVRGPLEQLSPDNREAFYQEGFRLHDLGVAGNPAASKMALDLWQKAYEANPGDTVARAYYGSSMALAGRDSAEPNAIFGNAIKGLVHLNRAISRDRNNPRIRLLRAYLAYSLPEVFFHQTKRAIKDFRFLKMVCEQEDSVFPRELYHKILYDLGAAYQRTGDSEKAQKVWGKLMKDSPDSKYKALLQERMGAGDEDQPEENNK
ncbi:MAG: tetratricopeptide repeat protein [Actinobacteria bacterium]|nr:tetratricopeptide repeat protein [Actinomycetota bacterium]